jgi:hypothetical protein
MLEICHFVRTTLVRPRGGRIIDEQADDIRAQRLAAKFEKSAIDRIICSDCCKPRWAQYILFASDRPIACCRCEPRSLTATWLEAIPKKTTMTTRAPLTILAVLAVAMRPHSVLAQGRGGGMVSPAASHARPIGVRGGPARLGFAHVHRSGRYYAGPVFWPYSSSDSEPETIEAPAPQVVVLQAPQATAPSPTTSPAESLVLELRGDRWVRLTNHGQAAQLEPTPAPTLPSGLPAAIKQRITAVEPPVDLPRATLVFRDGHTEEIQKYVIVGAALYTTADYWSTGSWTRKVQIAELDVPATLKLNQERGTRFRLPSGPNEVMMRP